MGNAKDEAASIRRDYEFIETAGTRNIESLGARLQVALPVASSSFLTAPKRFAGQSSQDEDDVFTPQTANRSEATTIQTSGNSTRTSHPPLHVKIYPAIKLNKHNECFPNVSFPFFDTTNKIRRYRSIVFL
jgi:hypothetical protein